MSVIEYIFLNYRWFFVCFYVLPLCLLYDIFSGVKNWLIFMVYSSPKQHLKKTKNIQKQVQRWIKNGRKVQMCMTRVGIQNICVQRPSYKNNFYKIKVNLLDILEINEENETVKVESLVTIKQLTSKLLPLGWTIPVVPGSDDITIGGLVLGTGMDSSSHKYGLFHNTCLSYELVMCDGSLITCSENENAELFHSVPWSYGTLGILTAVEIRLIPAPNYVKLQFKAYHNGKLAVEKYLEECNNEDNDFVEGLMYNDSQCVVVTGQMADEIESGKLNQIGKWYKPWFFQHAKSYFVKGYGEEYIPLEDYYHRHTRSTYWEMQDLIPFGNNIFFRMFLGWAVPPKLKFFKVTQAELIKKLYRDQHIMLDLIVPGDDLKMSIDTFNQKLKVYPIWLCPVRLDDAHGLVHKGENIDEMYVNVGIYGHPKAFDFHSEDSIKYVEHYVRQIKGFQVLYGDIHMSESEFRQQFDHTIYDKIRADFECDIAFPTIYEKLNLMKSEYPCDNDWPM